MSIEKGVRYGLAGIGTASAVLAPSSIENPHIQNTYYNPETNTISEVAYSPENQEVLLPNTIQVALTNGEHVDIPYNLFSHPYFNPVRNSITTAIQEASMSEPYDIVIPGVAANTNAPETEIQITPTPNGNEKIPIFFSTAQGGKLFTPEIPSLASENGWGVHEHSLADMLLAINAVDDDLSYNVDRERLRNLYVVPFQVEIRGSLALVDRETGELYAQGFIDNPKLENPRVQWQRVLQYDPESDGFVRSTDPRISFLADEELESEGLVDGMRFTTDTRKQVQITSNVPGLTIADIDVDVFDELTSERNLWRDLDEFDIRLIYNPTGSWEIGDKQHYTGAVGRGNHNSVIWQYDPTNPNEFIAFVSDRYLRSYEGRSLHADGEVRSMLTVGMDKLIGASVLSVRTLDTKRSPLDMYEDEIVYEIGQTEQGWKIFSDIDMTTASYIPPQS